MNQSQISTSFPSWVEFSFAALSSAMQKIIDAARRVIAAIQKDGPFIGICCATGAFMLLKALDKFPGLGVDRFEQLTPFIDGMSNLLGVGLPVGVFVYGIASLQAIVAAILFSAAWTGSRAQMILGFFISTWNFIIFLVGDILAKTYAKGVFEAAGGTFVDRTQVHLTVYIGGALLVVFLVRGIDYWTAAKRQIDTK